MTYLIKCETKFNYSLRPGLRPGSFDKKPNTNKDTKNITTV